MYNCVVIENKCFVLVVDMVGGDVVINVKNWIFV